MSQLKVNAIRHTGASSDAVTLASDGTCTAKITNNLSNRNLIINGACTVAQRSSSPVVDDSYRTVDRFALNYSGTDNHPTQEQHALTSSDTGPWEKGFRYSYHVTNGDQTSGAGTGDKMGIAYKIEAQDIANSGWNYTSASSYITLSFWVKSSVAGDYKGYLYTYDGTPKSYPFATGSLTANTWKKVTKKIPGHADLQFDNNNEAGFFIGIKAYIGTSFTSNVTEDAWMTYASGSRTADASSGSETWWTTNDATFEITGLQLEVGDVATDFEHRSYGDELARCQRYFYRAIARAMAPARGAGSSALLAGFVTPVPLRASPTISNGDDTDNGNFNIRAYETDGVSDSANTPTVGTRGFVENQNQVTIYQTGHSVTDDRVLTIYQGGGYMDFSSEL